MGHTLACDTLPLSCNVHVDCTTKKEGEPISNKAVNQSWPLSNKCLVSHSTTAHHTILEHAHFHRTHTPISPRSCPKTGVLPLLQNMILIIPILTSRLNKVCSTFQDIELETDNKALPFLKHFLQPPKSGYTCT